MTIAGRELELFIDNDFPSYQGKRAVFANLTRKKAAGKYDKSKAPRAFKYIIERGAQNYVKQHGSPDTKWHVMFTPDDRAYVARQYVAEFEEEYRLGNLDEFIPKKYRKKPPKKVAKSNPGTKLVSGYAYKLDAIQAALARKQWKNAPDDMWDTVMIGESEIAHGKKIGTRTIDGSRVVVFKVIRGLQGASPTIAFYAQMAHMVKG